MLKAKQTVCNFKVHQISDSMDGKMRHRKIFTLQEKIQILNDLQEPGFRIIDAAKKYGISSSTVAGLLKNETMLRCKIAFSHVAPDSKRIGFIGVEQYWFEEKLYEWLVEKREQNVKMNGAILTAKAKEMGGPELKLGGGWLRGFKRRYNISSFKTSHKTKSHEETANEEVILDENIYGDIGVSQDEMSREEKADVEWPEVKLMQSYSCKQIQK